MLENDKKQFAALVRSTMMVCGGSAPEPDGLRIWWATFKNYSMADISMAFSQYAQRGEAAPKPANILKILDRIKPDGRPTADEAWAMIPRDEATSAVMSDEMSEALGVAAPLLNEGDQVAARMAFKDVYNRAVDENRRNGVMVRWFPSLGHDPGGRETVLTQAVIQNRITMQHAVGLLQPDQADSLMARISGKLPAIENKKENRLRLSAEIKKIFDKKPTEKTEE